MLAQPPKPSALPVHLPAISLAVSDGEADSGNNQTVTWHTEFQRRFPSLSCDSTAARYHTHSVGPNQCCSAVVQEIAAPVSAVWSVVRRFDNPQAYKHFVKSCHVILGDGDVGTLREVQVVSGLPAARSTEKLEILDDESHVISFSVVGGDHRLANYRSVTTLHVSPSGEGSMVVESYVVDVPPGNTKDETCNFVDVIVRCNLQSLAKIAENLGGTKLETTSSL
ncbi:PREDICTED: abscisic acid receptor PYL4-like [Tarenaya hassleriana]|uniref:abscisic acid receptor PYL4-like n=1 Tax=Tarenaya hassleriana TaxID=28532 RepID=UPI00053C188F|nr:PREDICTED: abscisic acid receptor PYL4-like [Tarenaya hassleriana]